MEAAHRLQPLDRDQRGDPSALALDDEHVVTKRNSIEQRADPPLHVEHREFLTDRDLTNCNYPACLIREIQVSDGFSCLIELVAPTTAAAATRVC
jgi:hypothetical protein